MFDLFDPYSIEEAADSALQEGAGIYQENPENDYLIVEQMLLSELSASEIENLTENSEELLTMQEEGILQEKSIVRIDKLGKRTRAEHQACFVIAREKKDRDFNKIIRVWKMKAILKERIIKRYINEARKRVRANANKLARSSSFTARKVAARTKK